MTGDKAGPLSGVRILAVEQYGAGPFGSQYLADMGAEIIKIEDPTTGGEIGRYIPPYTSHQDSLFYQAFNRNKKAITLNMRLDEGKQLFRQLVTRADVVYSNLRGDQPAKLGIDYASLQGVNAAIVCTALTGFGLTGPRQSEPGYDYLIQGLTGLMSVTGDPGGPPAKAGVSVMDFAAGITAALGTVSAVYQAKMTGKGCDVDVSLMDSGLALLNYVALWHLNAGYEPVRIPESGHPSLVPSQLFATADGHIVIMCQKEKFWEKLCELIDRPELASDLLFATFNKRFENKDLLLPILREILQSKKTAEWLSLFQGHVPSAPVNSIAQALQEPHVLAREMIVTVPHPHWGELKQIACPIKLTDYTPPALPAPALGADTESVLQELLQFTADQIVALRMRGVI